MLSLLGSPALSWTFDVVEKSPLRVVTLVNGETAQKLSPHAKNFGREDLGAGKEEYASRTKQKS